MNAPCLRTFAYRTFSVCLLAFICFSAHHNSLHAQTQAPDQPQTLLADDCTASFPLQTKRTYLPLLNETQTEDEHTSTVAQPIMVRNGSTIFRRINGTTPLGDQLGDLGQYYSQVAPSIHSALVLENQSAITESVDIVLYGDNGYVARHFRGCRLAPQSQQAWAVEQKQMMVRTGLEDDAERVAPDALCVDDGLVRENGSVVEPVLHGIYHAEIALANPNRVSGYVLSRVEQTLDSQSTNRSVGEDGGDPHIHAQADFPPDGTRNAQSLGLAPSHEPKSSRPLFLFDETTQAEDGQVFSTYPLVESTAPQQHVHVPNVVATRNSRNWWDTELVVQNLRAVPTKLTLRLCDETGHCFENNQALLAGKERRAFLASHLFYSDDPRDDPTMRDAELLTQRSGWYAVSVLARSTDATTVPQIAVVSNIFKQPIASLESRPKAELGSSCLLTTAHSAGKKEFRFAFNRDAPTLLRLYNPTDSQLVIGLSLVAEDGDLLETRMVDLGQGATIGWDLGQVLQGFGEQQLAEALGLQIQAQEPIAAFLWQNGQAIHAERVGEGGALESRWAVPFWGAPTLPFRWDAGQRTVGQSIAGQDVLEPNEPERALLSRFGLGETLPGHELRPEWVRRLNWYNWFALRESCNAPVDPAADYSTYMALWRGLGRCANQTDRTCINSEMRLEAIRNQVPSSCAGRPLFLTNEPDVNAGDFMSYAELSRAIYLFRDWPGDLYSPTFGGPRYDQPTFPSEAEPWCETAVSVGVCPKASRCYTCIQDGDVDGLWDPYDIHLQGLETYFGQPDLWMKGRGWPIESVLDGLSLHFYTDYDSLATAPHWRAPLLRRYRDRADEAGWPIIVKEYGFITWPFRDGTFLELSRCNIVNRLDNARRVLQDNLGGYAAEHNQNPFKLFWFHAGCNHPDLPFYEKLCLFETQTELSYPVGQRWYQDAISQSVEDTQGLCSELRLPYVDHP